MSNMNLPGPTATNQTRLRHIDEVARALPQRVGVLTRLFLRHAEIDISLTEAGLLATLSGGPRRITELARLEGLAQPTVTLLVVRLEKRGWLVRERDVGDRRVVNVVLTDAGRAALEELREETRALLHDRLASMPDEHIVALMAATDSLEPLVAALQEADG
jgi:DNA-binding MarR family transcriptional regulator